MAPNRAQALPGVAPYATSKAGLAAFARVAMADVRDFGVKVSTIFPGLVNTQMGTRDGPVSKAMAKGVVPSTGAPAATPLPPSIRNFDIDPTLIQVGASCIF